MAFFVSYVIIKRDMDSSLKEYLLNDARVKFQLIKQDFSRRPVDISKLGAIYKKLYEKTGLEVRLIGKSGKTIFDSGGALKGKTESENADIISYSGRLSDGYLLQISYPAGYVEALKNGFESGVYIVFIVTFLVILGVSVVIAGSLSLPLGRLNRVVEAIKSGEEVNLPRFKDKNLARVATLVHGIYRAMKQKQKEIELEKEKLNHILEFMEEGVVLLKSDNTLEHCNSRFREMFGLQIKPGDNILSSIKDPDILGAVFDVLKSRSDRVMKIKGKTYNVYFKDIGEYLLMVFVDVDERMQYEYFKSELVGNISHELKTPIATLSAYAETLLMHGDIDDKTRKDLLEKLYAGSMRLNELVNDITELHRLENMSLSEIGESVDVRDVIKEIEFMYKDAPKEVVIDFKPARVVMLKEHLMSVLTNLISNALKYSTGTKIHVSVEVEGGFLKVVVDDEGPQIPKEERQRIFERFYTRSKSRNKQRSGTGLGLSIVKHIAMLYGGRVELKENSYGGNRFVVYLRVEVES